MGHIIAVYVYVYVKSAIKRCQKCKRFNNRPYKCPKMGPLPESRIKGVYPFSHTGVDYFGPFYCRPKENKPAEKIWVCLFTCMQIRAIHLEIVSDMSAGCFLLALRRFIARRGKPLEIYSDNALSFKLAEKALHTAQKDGVADFMSSKEIVWRYNPVAAPWMGGFYERMVGIVKTALRKSIGKACMTQEQFLTILTEVENIVNSRPLCYVSGELDDSIPLSPRHFLTLNPNSDLPILEGDDGDPDYIEKSTNATSLLESWRKGQTLLERFWEIWKKEYLTELKQTRHQHDVSRPPKSSLEITPKEGDIVLVDDKNLPRNQWKMGRVLSLIRSSDGEIRSCELRMESAQNKRNNATCIRPVRLLTPIEFSNENEALGKSKPDKQKTETKAHSFIFFGRKLVVSSQSSHKMMSMNMNGPKNDKSNLTEEEELKILGEMSEGEEYDPELDIPCLFDGETGKDPVHKSLQGDSGYRNGPHHTSYPSPMVIARSIGQSVAKSIVKSSHKITKQQPSKEELGILKKREKNRNKHLKRKARKAAAKLKDRRSAKDAQRRPSQATSQHGEIVVQGDGATLRYAPGTRSVHLFLKK